MNRIQLGLTLKEARRKANLTQEQLAERFVLDAKKVSRIERGIQFPEEDYLERLNVLIRNELDIAGIKAAILEIQSVESSSIWKSREETVSNEQLYTELQKIQAKLDRLILQLIQE
jgi:transcriptional regulator with XRE-family HTH domain